MRTTSDIILRILQVVVWLLLFYSCRSTEKTTQSHTRMTGSSQLAVLNHTLKADTTASYTISQANGYTFIKETQTITEYDTSKPGNPIAKETKTEKNTRKGVQAKAEELSASNQRESSDSSVQQKSDSELITQSSEQKTSEPVIETGIKWYVVAFFLSAVIISCISEYVQAKRKAKYGNT